jgi:hypothetical protein
MRSVIRSQLLAKTFICLKSQEVFTRKQPQRHGGEYITPSQPDAPLQAPYQRSTPVSPTRLSTDGLPGTITSGILDECHGEIEEQRAGFLSVNMTALAPPQYEPELELASPLPVMNEVGQSSASASDMPTFGLTVPATGPSLPKPMKTEYINGNSIEAMDQVSQSAVPGPNGNGIDLDILSQLAEIPDGATAGASDTPASLLQPREITGVNPGSAGSYDAYTDGQPEIQDRRDGLPLRNLGDLHRDTFSWSSVRAGSTRSNTDDDQVFLADSEGSESDDRISFRPLSPSVPIRSHNPGPLPSNNHRPRGRTPLYPPPYPSISKLETAGTSF